MLGVGEAIASRSCLKVLHELFVRNAVLKLSSSIYTGVRLSTKTYAMQVLLLNGSQDRETAGLNALDFVAAITDSLNRTHGDPHNSLSNLVSKQCLVFISELQM